MKIKGREKTDRQKDGLKDKEKNRGKREEWLTERNKAQQANDASMGI